MCLCGGAVESGWNYLCWESIVFTGQAWGLAENGASRGLTGIWSRRESLPPVPFDVPESSVQSARHQAVSRVGEDHCTHLSATLNFLCQLDPSAAWLSAAPCAVNTQECSSEQETPVAIDSSPETIGNQFWNIAMKQTWFLQTCP